MGLWQRALARVAAHASAQGAHLARTVVLVPYAQLMPWAQRHWALQFPQGFAPRFETTRNWARQLQVFEPSADDFAGDVARDTLTARALLDRVGQGAQREMLATPLQEAAAQLAPAVAAVPPGPDSSASRTSYDNPCSTAASWPRASARRTLPRRGPKPASPPSPPFR